jgi:hypothetical protein
MQPLFSFRWRSLGSTVGRREAGRRRRLVRLALVWEEEEDGRLGRECELGLPRGRGPVGRGGEWPVEKRKRWAAAGPKGRMGRLAAGPVGPKVRKNSFLNNILIFKYTMALEICRRRFRRNFDMRIFPEIL